MNQLVVKGFSAWKIFLKNKVASSIMMLVSGIMMLIAAINGKGNDTKTLPTVITAVGTVLAFWSFYRIGYIKSNYDKKADRLEKTIERQVMFSQILETALYIAVAVAGFFLVLNEGFTNKVLNLMAGGFTILNGIFGVIYIWKNFEKKDFKWKFRVILTIVELVVGMYFVIASDFVETPGFIVMGCLTTVAGAIEVFSSVTAESLRDTVKDGKDIVNTLKKS